MIRTPVSKISAKVIIIVAMLLLSTASIIVPTAQATSGTLTITSDTVLTADHYGNIVIAADGITLDGNGHSVIGYNYQGIGVNASGKNAVTIKNLNIRNFDTGIRLDNSISGTITGNNISTTIYGILLNSASGETIDGNTVAHAVSGINLQYSGNQSGGRSNILTNNYVSYTGSNGIILWQSAGNKLINNDVSHNDGRGIYSRGNHRNIFVNNTVSRNTYCGFEIESSFNFLAGNVVAENTCGIQLRGVNDTLTGNTISNNLRFGLGVTAYNSGDKIYHNNFIGNLLQASIGGNGNLFNLPAPNGGNYWDSYDTAAEGCIDTSPADSFCDSPYILSGGQDSLPWTKMNGWVKSSAITAPIILSFQGYDFNNKGEVSVLVNNQTVATLPTRYSPQNAKTYLNVSLDISKFIIPGGNTVTFRQNIYSSGVRNVKVSGSNELIYSTSTFYGLSIGGSRQSITYRLNVGESSSPSLPTYTLTFQGYDYNSKDEVIVLVNNKLVDMLPAFYGSGQLFANFSLDISQYVMPGGNTITFQQNRYITSVVTSSGVKNVQVIGPDGTVVYSNSTYYSLWDGRLLSITYIFNIGTSPPPTVYTIEWEGYDYDSKQEVTVNLNGQTIGTLPSTWVSANNDVWKSFSMTTSSLQSGSSNTLTFTQNLGSSKIRNLLIKDSNGNTVYSLIEQRSIWLPSKPSTTYSFSLP